MSFDFPCGAIRCELVSRKVEYTNQYLRRLIGRDCSEDSLSLLDEIFTKASMIFIDSYLYPMLLSEGRCDERLLTLKHSDGSRIPVVVNLETRGKGDVVWSVMPAVERNALYQELLTAREAVEAHAGQLQQDLERLTSEADIGFADMSIGTRMLHCNASFLKHHRLDVANPDIVWAEFLASYAHGDSILLPKVIEKVIKLGTEQRITAEVNTGEDRSRFLELRVYLTSANSEKVLRLITIDISERIRMQNELEEAEREAQAALSTLKLTQEKQNTIYGMVAHELRTPVAAITMMAADGDDESWQQNRENVLRSSRDLINTIDDMRLLVNPDLKRPIRPEKFNVKAFNATIASSVASIVASTGVRYSHFDAISLPLLDEEFVVDTYRARVVLTNLIKNACIHSRGNKVWTICRHAFDAHSGEFLEWVVGDNGVGIPQTKLTELFAAGVRGDSEADGTGFGLYIAKNWIEEINGTIEYCARQKGGSEFIVRVPLVPANNPEQSHASGGAIDYSQVDALLPKLNALMAEDEPMLRMLGSKLLSKMVGNVSTAENGRVALEQFDPSHNIILTDYFMPEMSGVELALQLREQGYQGVILGVTAATIGEQRTDMLEAGVDIVLPKPLTAEKFKNAVSQLLSEGRFDGDFGRGAADWARSN